MTSSSLITGRLTRQLPRLLLTPSLFALVLSRLAFAQAVPAAAGPAPHPLGAAVATSTIMFQQITGIVPESDGRLFVADGRARVVYQLDSTLKNSRVVLDSTAGRANTFSASSFLMAFRGDSVFFYDKKPGALVVIDPNGGLGRTMSPPIGATGFGPLFGPGSSGYLASGPASTRSGVHEGGPLGASKTMGIIYRIDGDAPPLAPVPPPGQPADVLRYDDTLIVMRWNPDARTVDTVARLSTGRMYIRILSADSSRTTSGKNLFIFLDDAVVMSDGSVALFHARDYRIDWVDVHGTRTDGPRIPFAWRRISDDDRTRIVDSINGFYRHRVDSLLAKRAADSAATGSPPMTTATSISADGERLQRQIPQRPPVMPSLVEAGDVPDFYPPTTRASVFADGDNHVWIKQLPSDDKSVPAIWDVIDRSGALIDRVSIPASQTVVGFAPGGFVYTTVSDAGKVQLLKNRVR